ncbi:hypothetical protein HRE53_27120 (plasmid) [Acaryochloris sp. 'Moss Beach']|uniref:hypothetical protein n=1 Tax=Acaryochloris TaxID=155977 RepID=UPI001BAE8AB3|nr:MULTISPECIES: hypothetical protein [Acaryochloris]QUY40309.1 hypothetical protein I1H34_00385 [Acaryochloris marina S15]UJB72276.1 hypothetical protein HRE53_27120 [Acaryochloris sp. 'Moss Beach']
MSAVQTALPLKLPQSGPVKTTGQRQSFEKMLVELRQEAAEILAIANRMFQQCWQRLQDVPTPEMGSAVKAYHKKNGIVIPQVNHSGPISSKPSRPYRPWPLERKYRERIRRMQARAQKKFSIPSLQFDFIQLELVRLPHYFGICPLPNEESCTLNLQDLLLNPAIEREKQLREQESQASSGYP